MRTSQGWCNVLIWKNRDTELVSKGVKAPAVKQGVRNWYGFYQALGILLAVKQGLILRVTSQV